MKIAHIITAYKNPEQVSKLIKALDHPDFYFFIHLDKKIDRSKFDFLGEYERVVFIKDRVLCNWGGFSFVNAILNSIREVLADAAKFDFINLLSGQDYPIKPVKDIYSFLNNNIGKCFLSYDTDPNHQWWKHAIKRTELYHFTDISFRGKYFVQGLLNKYLPVRKLPVPIELYGNNDSSWWTLSPDCCAYVLDYVATHRRLTKFMKYTWAADEFFITSIIMNSPFKDKVINNNLRYITWSVGLPNPHILTLNDLKDIKQSDKFFARKFDTTVDASIFDAIDTYIQQ
ncbi:beta-1,6-N-acetylglucosaminyltransferase [Pedobacter aquatilis]|uniref:beta-1,6-N-acetylglucosaminyltransferase n=1 Tax=Pedobacter aquatilis TaxID=351343 RepID=UPI00292F0B80|nr:beta-1,6-N-acetylglucosaminyltransferase [Pedobacter aquatilis]